MTTRRILAEVALGLLCLSACWPLVELSKAGSVGVPIVVAALVVWAIGAGLRRVGARSWLIVLAQAAAVVVSPLAALAAHGVSPTPSALRDAGHEAQKVANSSVAPLPAIAGVIAALTLGAALVALVVDYVGGTSKLPAATVLPVAAPFVLATTALGQTLPLPYFAAAAAAWALLMWLSTSRSRTLTGAPVFAAVTVLAVAGAALQGATRNPLGDPGLLGLSAGAGLAVAAGMALGVAGSTFGVLALAAVGTLVAAALGYAVAAAATRRGRTTPGAPSPMALVLAGAAITAGATAGTTALLVLSPTVQDRLRFWAVGTVARADLGEALALAPVIAVGLLATVAVAPGLDALALGDDLAHGLGGRPERVRAVLLGAVVLLTAAAVALAGPVGFVGLLVPHALRRLRPPSTRALMVGCALWGAVLVILADLAGRLVVAPGEIHLGVTTVLLGVPVLLALLRRPGVAA